MLIKIVWSVILGLSGPKSCSVVFWTMYIYSNKQNDEIRNINEQLVRHWAKVLY